MAKDDFHVIAYRILDYLYECMKKGESPEVEYLNEKTYGINERYFNKIIELLYKNDYITGVLEIDRIGYQYNLMKITYFVSITLKGIEYLTDNTFIEKAKNFLRETRESVPFV